MRVDLCGDLCRKSYASFVQKNALQILKGNVFISGHEKLFFHKCKLGSSNEEGVSFPPANWDSFGYIQGETAKR